MPGPQNLFLWGYSGSGKTLFLCEALKIKLNKIRKLQKEGKNVRVIVTVFNSNITTYTFMPDTDPSGSLMQDMRHKYLRNITDEPFIDFIHFKVLLENHAVGEYLYERDKLGHTINF